MRCRRRCFGGRPRRSRRRDRRRQQDRAGRDRRRRSNDDLRFAHALMRAAVLGALGPARQVELHLRAAAALGDVDALVPLARRQVHGLVRFGPEAKDAVSGTGRTRITIVTSHFRGSDGSTRSSRCRCPYCADMQPRRISFTATGASRFDMCPTPGITTCRQFGIRCAISRAISRNDGTSSSPTGTRQPPRTSAGMRSRWSHPRHFQEIGRAGQARATT